MMGPTRRLERIARLAALVSGLVLFAFAGADLCNDAIGLVSLETMGTIAEWKAALIHSWLGTAILSAAMISHIGTALWFVAHRATLRMSVSDAIEIVSGITIPVLLLPVVVETRGANILFGVADDTLYRLAKLWPEHGYLYIVLIVLLWGHGCLGVHQWLKPRPGYARFAPVLGIAALALPIAATAGLVASARVVSVLMADVSFAEQIRAATHWPSGAEETTLWRVRLIAVSTYGVLLLVIAGALALRFLRIVVAPKIDIAYVNGPMLKAATGPTLLEISRINAVSHADACGGRGRCLMCSVRIEQGAASLPPRTAAEVALLGSGDQAIRLACQIRPTAALTVTRLVHTAGAIAADPDFDTAGTEREVVALCVHLQDHATLARTRAAYDAIFLLNAFLDAAYASVAVHQGWLVRTTGGGLVAVFGRDGTVPAACQAAIAASAGIDVALDRLNETFAAELGRPLAGAMGLALGRAYLGRIGAGPSKTLTAIGPVIDTACGLAERAEQRGTQLLSDAAVFQAAGMEAAAFKIDPSAGHESIRQVVSTGHARLLQRPGVEAAIISP